MPFDANFICVSSMPSNPAYVPLTELIAVSPLNHELLEVTGALSLLSLVPGTQPGT